MKNKTAAILKILELLVCIVTLALTVSSNYWSWVKDADAGWENADTTKALVAAAAVGMIISFVLFIWEQAMPDKLPAVLKWQCIILFFLWIWFWITSIILLCKLEQRRNRIGSVEDIFLAGECFGLIAGLVYLIDTWVSYSNYKPF